MNIKATLDENSNKIILEITHNDKTDVIESTIKASGIFKFSYHHYELKKPDTYYGVFLSNNKFIIYPILGVGVISDKPITIE